MRTRETSGDFTIIFRGSYIHVLMADNFEITPEGNRKVWEATAEACRQYDCFKVLSEGNVQSRRLKAFDAFKSGTQASEIRGLQNACLFYNYKTDDVTEFFKTVAANRGVRIEFFTDKKTALKWLGVEENG